MYKHWMRSGNLYYLKMMFDEMDRVIKTKPSKPPEYYRQNGPRERARRRRQIERGILKVTP